MYQYALDHSSFYQDYYKGYKFETMSDFYKLPIINKKIMMENFSTLTHMI